MTCRINNNPTTGKKALIYIALIATSIMLASDGLFPQIEKITEKRFVIDTAGFYDGAHHWYDIYDEGKVINPTQGQKRYNINQVSGIAENILLYQKENGGWPKNYDMLAILTDQQKDTLARGKGNTNTTFDNGSTYSQVEYLAKAYAIKGTERFREASLGGIDFMLSAQYPNGGFPQCYPDTGNYRKYITFNDGAMIGVLSVFHDILSGRLWYSFIDSIRLQKIRQAYDKGVDCILKCQIEQEGDLTAWCQQHDNFDFRPRNARTFEPAALCGEESADIVLFLMTIKNPKPEIVRSVRSAVSWFKKSKLNGIKVKTIKAPRMIYKYAISEIDRIVVKDAKATPIWARFYELGSLKPLFCNRDGIPVYSLAEVDRERRSGYTWYSYEPEKVLKKYNSWEKKNASKFKPAD